MNTKKRNIGARLGALLLSLCLIMGLLPVTALADGTEWDGPTKAFVKAVFSNAVETTGADSQICAATVKDESGDFELHYVYSPDSIWNIQLFDKVRDGLAEPYKSLIPELEKDDNDKKGFLFLSDDQYEDMELNWADPPRRCRDTCSGQRDGNDRGEYIFRFLGCLHGYHQRLLQRL